jgi:endonuclease/exonuclease/phosphatase family metal-dependent hydrolase
MAKKRTFSSFLKKVILTLNILAVLSLLASYGALYIDPRHFWPLAFFGLLYPVILAVNLIFILLWLVTWKKYIWISLVAVLAGWTQIMALFPLRFAKDANPPPGSMKFLSYNVHGFAGFDRHDKGTRDKILSFTDSQKPDVLCIQEFTLRHHDDTDSITAIVNETGYPHVFFRNYFDIKKKNVVNGIVTCSRFNIVNNGFLRDGKKRVFAVFSDLVVSGDTLRLYNLHLVSIRFGYDEYTFYDNLKNKKTEDIQFKDKILTILKKLRTAFLIRSEQVEMVVSHIKTSPYPVVVCGDFNDTPFSYSYHQLTRGLNDAFRKAGSGFPGNTYAGQLPAYRIDYILYSEPFKAYRYEREVLNFSDHYPVSTFINFEKGKK